MYFATTAADVNSFVIAPYISSPFMSFMQFVY